MSDLRRQSITVALDATVVRLSDLVRAGRGGAGLDGLHLADNELLHMYHLLDALSWVDNAVRARRYLLTSELLMFDDESGWRTAVGGDGDPPWADNADAGEPARTSLFRGVRPTRRCGLNDVDWLSRG